MKRPALTALLATTFLSVTLTLGGCAAPQGEQAEPDANINGGAERSYSDEELQTHDGSSIFPDTFTFEELMEDYRCQPGQTHDGAFGPGAYIVGAEGAPGPGTYYVSGSHEKTGDLHAYYPTGEENTYHVKFSLGYLGFMFLNLSEGDAIFFKPPSEENTLQAAPEGSLEVSWPLTSGLYRVGIDIPQGTYTVTQSAEEAPVIAAKAYQYPQVNIYSSLDFGTDNIALEQGLPPLEEEVTETDVTVEDGQFLELYGCIASQKEA